MGEDTAKLKKAFAMYSDEYIPGGPLNEDKIKDIFEKRSNKTQVFHGHLADVWTGKRAANDCFPCIQPVEIPFP